MPYLWRYVFGSVSVVSRRLHTLSRSGFHVETWSLCRGCRFHLLLLCDVSIVPHNDNMTLSLDASISHGKV